MYIQDVNARLIKEDRIVAIWKDEQKAQVRAEVDGLLGHVILLDVSESAVEDRKDLIESFLDRFLLKDSKEVSIQLIADALEDLNKLVRDLSKQIAEEEDYFLEDEF